MSPLRLTAIGIVLASVFTFPIEALAARSHREPIRVTGNRSMYMPRTRLDLRSSDTRTQPFTGRLRGHQRRTTAQIDGSSRSARQNMLRPSARSVARDAIGRMTRANSARSAQLRQRGIMERRSHRLRLRRQNTRS